MSGSEPIAPNSPLGRALGADHVPKISADFADRVIARTADRPAPLPEMRRGDGGTRRLGRFANTRRLGIGLAVTGALATAAAAAGLLDDLPIDIPSADQVWSAITGAEPNPASKPNLSEETSDSVPDVASEPDTDVTIEGPIDTPEELEEAFRRADEAREDRRATRQQNIDRRINNVIERRRAQGLPPPTPEQEERIRGRINRVRDRLETRADERIDERRDDLRERIEAGEELTPQELRREQRPQQSNPAFQRRIEELRNLPPAERRDRIRELREQRNQRRQQRLEQESGTAPPSVETESEETPETESDQ